jgi:hypothetical protein
MQIAVISDLFPVTQEAPSPLVPNSELFLPKETVPTLEQLAPFDLIVVLGTVADADRATELSGVLDHLFDRAKLVALLFYVRLDDPGLAAIAGRLLPFGYTSIQRAVQVSATSPAWEGFFRSYGTSACQFINGDTRVLAVMPAEPPQPAALELAVRAGTLYLIPFHVADRESPSSETRVIRDLVAAITSERAEMLPVEYLADLRLPGEEEVLETIHELEQDLATRQAEADRLYRYRLLLGPLSGDRLEELVRDALGVILEPTEFCVEDRPELFSEDFWITGPAGEVALAEVKGIGSGVGRREINQVDNHREKFERETSELPGLLIVNVYRNDPDLNRRTGERVHPNIVAALRRQNVTLLRSADLYKLLDRRLRGLSAGELLIRALTSGGGWFEVTDDGVTLHGGEAAPLE